MQHELDGHRYQTVLGSDVINDGMYLELRELAGGDDEEVLLCAYWSDTDGRFAFHCYRQELPFVLVETFIQEARQRLPRSRPARNGATN